MKREAWNQKSDEIFKQLEVAGGPTNVLSSWFTKKVDTDPLYQRVKRLIERKQNTGSYQDKTGADSFVCDDILALYLIDNAQKVIPKFFKTMVVFVHFY